MIRTTLAAAILAATLPMAAMAEGKTHYVAIHVDDGDPRVMNMALNNAQNVDAYYKSQGDEVMIEVVAYGPGLNMFIEDGSPVKDRISAMSLELENIAFAACGNTLKKMSENKGNEIKLMTEAVVVPSGVVRLIELQEQGYAYVRP